MKPGGPFINTWIGIPTMPWPDDQQDRRGRYTKHMSARSHYEKSNLECPYCRESMSLLVITGARTNAMRVVDTGKIYNEGTRLDAIVHEIPETHDVYKCKNCDQIFTQPKNVLRGDDDASEISR